MAGTVAFTDSDEIEVGGGPSFTHTAVGIGTAAADRQLLIIAGGVDSTFTAPAATISTLAVGGTPATFLVRSNPLDGNNSTGLIEAWIIAFPTGTAADIDITYSETMFFSTVIVFELNGIDPALYDSATTPTVQATTHDVSLDVPAGGVAISGSVSGPSTAGHTWTGTAEVAEVGAFSDAFSFSAADYEAATAQTPLDVDVAYSVGETVSSAVSVSFAEAASGAGNEVSPFLSRRRMLIAIQNY